ncbi:MAG: type II CRISPR-associated endonuclease Cas1 [Candidatus Obscuribacter sp.]|nr:type II CRISPR-associated endonuclease Cas1 [Candidatus Obscuribacter sp.]
MANRIIEISNPAHLSLRKEQLIIKIDGSEAASIPIEDMAMLILNNPAITFSQAIISKCLELNVGLVITNEKRMPAMILQPLDGHSIHTKILRQQIEVSLPRKKQLWQVLVRAKIRQQAKVLSRLGLDSRDIDALAARVRSGDPDNLEAQAARLYWPRLFGQKFRRNQQSSGINCHLNYGYAVLRAAVARAVVASGMHPALSVQHKNQFNAFCLVDDLIEPLRARVDLQIASMPDIWMDQEEPTVESKRYILDILTQESLLAGQSVPLLVGLERYAASFRSALIGESMTELQIPSL